MLQLTHAHMPRTHRTDVGDQVYHVLNRANARVQIFDDKKDYECFEQILKEAVARTDMPKGYLAWLNKSQSVKEEKAIELST